MDLSRRRRFIFELDALVDLLDEDFDDPDSATASHAGVPDPLLAELGRGRTSRMRDVAATIQREQDEIIRAPANRCLIVQGGPGTGKTAVGLHRAAFLLFEERERLTRDGVLILGPNKLFLSYISEVLPTLGERSVRQATIETLIGKYEIDGLDSQEVAAIKGGSRMADVIRSACMDSVSAVCEAIEFPVGLRLLRVPGERVDAERRRAMASVAPWNVRRTLFRDGVLRAALQDVPDDAMITVEELGKGLVSGLARRQLDRYWKPTAPEALIRRLLTSQGTLERAGAGLLTPEEQAVVLRKPRRKGECERWTRHDLALLDEAESFVQGHTRRYGHIVVDEAQDLTAMELRLIGRRASGGSMTVLGDLAQATRPGAASKWEEVAEHLAPPSDAVFLSLTVGYRLPAQILTYANRLLPTAAPGVTPTRSIREEGGLPTGLLCSKADLAFDVASHTEELVTRYNTVAVILPASVTGDIVAALVGRGLTFSTDASAALDGHIAVLSPQAAKGLEFDAVLVVEPVQIIESGEAGGRALFVALTRAVQELVIISTAPLPALLSLPAALLSDAGMSSDDEPVDSNLTLRTVV
jgi:DNA helicase IV